MQVLIEARVSAEQEGCSVAIEGNIIVDADTTDSNPPLTVDCELNTTAISTTFAQDAVAEAVSSVSVFACENGTSIQANVSAIVRSPLMPGDPTTPRCITGLPSQIYVLKPQSEKLESRHLGTIHVSQEALCSASGAIKPFSKATISPNVAVARWSYGTFLP